MAATAMMDRAREITARPGFDDETLWLTFSLAAVPAKLAAVAVLLSPSGAVNLGGAEDCFIYPKLPVANDTGAIVACVERVLGLASGCGVRVLAVDLDTTPDVGPSAFAELARFWPDDRQAALHAARRARGADRTASWRHSRR